MCNCVSIVVVVAILLAAGFIWLPIFRRKVTLIKIGSVHLQSPPRVFEIPLLGSLISMIYHGNNFYTKCLPSYGPIACHSVGNEEFITINDPKITRKVLSSRYCNQRPKTFRQIGTFQDKSHPLSFVIAKENHENFALQRRNMIMKHFSQFTINKQFIKVFHRAINTVYYKKLDDCIVNDKLFTNVKTTSARFAFMITIMSMFGIDCVENSENNNNHENVRTFNRLLDEILTMVRLFFFATVSAFFPFLNKFNVIKSKLKHLDDINASTLNMAGEYVDVCLAKINRNQLQKHCTNSNPKYNSGDGCVFETLYHESMKNEKMTLEMLKLDVWSAMGMFMSCGCQLDVS